MNQRIFSTIFLSKLSNLWILFLMPILGLFAGLDDINRSNLSVSMVEKSQHSAAKSHVLSSDEASFLKEALQSLPDEPSAVCKGEGKNKRAKPKKEENRFDPIILQAANKYQVDPALIKAIIMAESGYNPNAVSKKGAKGLMQLMPVTAKWLGVDDGFNPKQNIDGGVRYFNRLLKRFNGDIKLALAAYNAGSRKVRKYNGVPPYRATQYYISKVFEYYEHYKKQVI